MHESDYPSQPCYSMRPVWPFLAVLKTYPGFPVEILAPLEAMDPDERRPISKMQELLEAGVVMSKDPGFGLRWRLPRANTPRWSAHS